MKKVLALILAALTLLPCAVAAAEGTFRVGMECNYAPYNWTQAEPSRKMRLVTRSCRQLL